LQPANVEPLAAIAVSVTLVPASKSPAHVAPQLIAPTLLVTVPEPAPDFVTVNVNAAAVTTSVALAVWTRVPASLATRIVTGWLPGGVDELVVRVNVSGPLELNVPVVAGGPPTTLSVTWPENPSE